MSVPTKASAFLLGSSYSSPATIGHGGTPVNSSSNTIAFGAAIKWWVTYPGSPGTVAVTIQPQVSDDGSHWTNDGGPFVAQITASTTVSGVYIPPQDEVNCRLQLVNADTSVDATAVVNASNTASIA